MRTVTQIMNEHGFTLEKAIETQENERRSGPLNSLVGLRPTDEEIELEARQWAEEQGTYGALHKTSWILGAQWARGVAQFTKQPNEMA
jgi:hypothetical protein